MIEEALRAHIRNPLAVGFLAAMCIIGVFAILIEDNSLLGFGIFFAASLLGYAAGLNG